MPHLFAQSVLYMSRAETRKWRHVGLREDRVISRHATRVGSHYVLASSLHHGL